MTTRMSFPVAIFLFLAETGWTQPTIERIGSDYAGMAEAVVVVGRCPLTHTAMILPLDGTGSVVGADDVGAQIARTMQNLQSVLKASQSDLDRILRINVYAAEDAVVSSVQSVFATEFAAASKPAVTYVVGELPASGALVAMDAIAVAESGVVEPVRTESLPARPYRHHAAFLPEGRAVYVSGQAESGDTLADATTNTLSSLRATLEWMGLDLGDVVHVKTFMKPMAQVDEVDDAIDSFFGNAAIPPVTHVEWTNDTPIEIEIIASAPDGTATQASGPVSYLTPPGMTESPVFCRVTVIDSERRIYVSGLTGDDTLSAESEVRSLYAELGRILQAADSDLNHLVKATYYCATEATSAALNQVRPDFYDPKRPPAASKALVRGTGVPGRGIIVDMVAVGME